MTQDLMTAAMISIAVFLLLRRFLGGGKRITSAEARAKVAEGALLLDVRTPPEFRAEGLPGAKNIPVQLLAGRIGELDQSQPIVVYCRSGARSSRAASVLRAKGFEVHDLGPARAW